jgi:hypothetical protein
MGGRDADDARRNRGVDLRRKHRFAASLANPDLRTLLES